MRAILSGQYKQDVLVARGSVEVCMNTEEPDLPMKRLNVKREVSLADALAYDVLNNRYTIEIASFIFAHVHRGSCICFVKRD
jgi:hypothetical protein